MVAKVHHFYENHYQNIISLKKNLIVEEFRICSYRSYSTDQADTEYQVSNEKNKVFCPKQCLLK